MFWLCLTFIIHPVGQFFGSSFWGMLSDRIGRRKALFLSLLGSFIGYAGIGIMLMTKTLVGLIICRFYCGFVQGNLSIVQAAITDRASGVDRGVLLGRLYAIISLAFIVGPFSVGRWIRFSGLTPMNCALAFWAIGALMVPGALYLFFRAKDVPIANRTEGGVKEQLKGVVALFQSKPLVRIFTTNFLIYIGIFSYFRFYTTHFFEAFSFGADELGTLAAYGGICIAFSQLFVMKVASKIFGEARLLSISAITFCVGIFLMTQNTDPNGFFYTLPLAGIGLGLSYPLCTLLASRATASLPQGKSLGLNQSVRVIAEVVSGLAGGVIAGYGSKYALIAGGVVSMCGGLMLLQREPTADIDVEKS